MSIRDAMTSLLLHFETVLGQHSNVGFKIFTLFQNVPGIRHLGQPPTRQALASKEDEVHQLTVVFCLSPCSQAWKSGQGNQKLKWKDHPYIFLVASSWEKGKLMVLSGHPEPVRHAPCCSVVIIHSTPSSLSAYLAWIPEYKVITNGGSRATGAQGLDPRH